MAIRTLEPNRVLRPLLTAILSVGSKDRRADAAGKGEASMQVTAAYASNAAIGSDSSSSGSHLPVGLIAGTTSRFADETAALLRSRLKAASLVLACLATIAVVRSVFVPAAPVNVMLQTAGLVTLLTFFLVLKGNFTISLFRLRVIELVLFGELFFAVALAEWLELRRSAVAGEFDAVVVIRFFASFSVLILTYGMLIPNHWKRAAAILLPVACIPFAVMWITMSEKVNEALQFEPLPLVAAVLAVFGTHVVNETRQTAFNARRFGQYRLKEKLGVGGMGEVYRAEHLLLKRPCVIKLIRNDKSRDAAAVALFEREVQCTAQLTHWNSVEIFDYGHTDDGLFYYVMEYLPGQSLEDLVKRHGPLAPERAVHFLRQICRALREAHQLGLIHRDLKPANIFAATLGGVHDVAKLLDFGLVHQASTDPPPVEGVSQGNGFCGSPLYMPPEQALAYGEVDGRADIYALGGVAYFLLTGRPPFDGSNPIEVIMDHASKSVTPPGKFALNVPADLEQIVLRCLEKAPADRFQDVTSLERALAGCQCADGWTDELAAKWWNTVGGSPVNVTANDAQQE